MLGEKKAYGEISYGENRWRGWVGRAMVDQKSWHCTCLRSVVYDKGLGDNNEYAQF